MRLGRPAQQLKVATLAEHREIEGAVRVMAEDFTRAEYIQLLIKFYAVVEPPLLAYA